MQRMGEFSGTPPYKLQCSTRRSAMNSTGVNTSSPARAICCTRSYSRNNMRPLLVTLLSTALLLQSQASKSSAADTVKRFYNTYRAQKFSGLPDAAQLAKLAPYLSASLQTLIRAAQKEQDRCEKAAPDEKPPWVEGDMFTSNFEGFTWFQIQNGPDTIVAFEYMDHG